MPLTLDALVQEALELPLDEREILANRLLESIEDQNEEPVSLEWEAEIARRIEEIDSGKAVLIPAEEVFARMRAKYPFFTDQRSVN